MAGGVERAWNGDPEETVDRGLRQVLVFIRRCDDQLRGEGDLIVQLVIVQGYVERVVGHVGYRHSTLAIRAPSDHAMD